jgi:ribosomal protein S27AE
LDSGCNLDPAEDPTEPPPTNEETVINIALNVMCGKGWLDHEIEPPDELLKILKRLYRENPLCQIEVKFTGDVIHDMCAGRPGEMLAAAYECEGQEHWEREEAPRWSCPCGYLFGLYEWHGSKTDFYTLTEDGLFDQKATDCPRCKRNLANVREDYADGQLGFAF